MTYDPETAPAAPHSAGNVPEYSVSQIAGALKRTVEDAYPYVRVRGEISRPSMPGSGHLYLTLKDDQATLQAVCWRGSVAKLGIRPEEGMEVVCTGRLTTYPGRSSYQMVIERMELAGQGALLKMLEDRKKRLAAEGLFDSARKKPIPFLPKTIGVITSPTGAVIRDILHRLADRFPLHVLIWPVLVQGDGAAGQIAEAIRGFNERTPNSAVPRPDLLIVARGGGSIEDLWAFNEEAVVRAAAASTIPLISAVGHETDTTLIDFAADLRAPTPTAAAEMAVPVRREVLAQVQDLNARMLVASNRLLDERRMRIQGLARGLGDPQRLLESAMQRLDDRAERLEQAPRRWIVEKRLRLETIAGRLSDRPIRRSISDGQRRLVELTGGLVRTLAQRQTRTSDQLESLAQRLESVSYRRVLERGYTVVRDAEGTAIATAEAIAAGQALSIAFYDGTVAVWAEGEVRPKPRSRKNKTSQPSLFE